MGNRILFFIFHFKFQLGKFFPSSVKWENYLLQVIAKLTSVQSYFDLFSSKIDQDAMVSMSSHYDAVAALLLNNLFPLNAVGTRGSRNRA